MNARTMVLVGAMLLLGVGLGITLLEILTPPPTGPRVTVAMAAEQIEPYTVITEDMVNTGPEVPAAEARDGASWRVEQVVGKMTTDLIVPGDVFTAVNARPIEEVRFTDELGLEIVSFQAAVDQLVGGRLRPGHVINLYGTGDDEENRPFTTLVEPRLWVVGVSSGGRPSAAETPELDPETGEVAYRGDGRPTTLVTVAVEPDKAVHIIDALSARGLTPYVTLAASGDGMIAMATVPPTIGPPTAASLPPDIAGTATALAGFLRATPMPTVPKDGFGPGAAP
jgi:hypothetical protein